VTSGLLKKLLSLFHFSGALNKFLCSKALVIFSRISYAVYLTQIAVFAYNIGSIRASEHFSVLRSVSILKINILFNRGDIAILWAVCLARFG
jgi:hypothetical protein